MQTAIQAISNPRRRQILKLVYKEELPAKEIAARFDVTWSAVSQNLRVLADAGLLTERRKGTQRFYKANRSAIRPLEQILKAMWAEDLKDLKKAVETAARGE